MDNESTLWVLSNRLPRMIYSSYDYNLYNFNVFRLNPSEIVRGTDCGKNFGAAGTGGYGNNEIGVGGEFQNKQPNYFQGGSFSSASASANSYSFSRNSDDDD